MLRATLAPIERAHFVSVKLVDILVRVFRHPKGERRRAVASARI
jgi:hypothetical protein